MGDDAPGFGDFNAVAQGKKKKKDKETLRAEAQKKKEEEDAKKPTKGKPSSFFAMETDMNSNADPNGYHKVPNQE